MKLCTSIIKSIIEKEDEITIDYNKLFNLYYYEPGGTSTKNLVHWLQSLTTHDISFFDYRNLDDYDKNFKYYGTNEPPIINMDGLREMQFKSLFFLGEKDPYVPELSVLYFREICYKSEFVIIKNYNHLSYIWSVTAKEEIYDKVLDLINNYQ